ncbi:MAG: FAD:protein FMN transferase [Pseudomonadota bacterium]
MSRPPWLTGLLLLAAWLLSGCERAPETEQLTFHAFGTLVEVTLYPSGEYDLAGIEAQLQEELEVLHRSWHAWEPGSLGRTNQLLALQGEFSAPPSVLPLIERGREMEALSDGLFNPALGRLIAAWGFHQDEPAGPPPDPETLESLLDDPPDMRDIERDGVRLRGTHPDLQLDFGGLAKGLAVARILELLDELGVEAAIFNAGGDLMTLGRPAPRPWRVGVRDPRGGLLGGVELGPGEALFTSGDYERGYEWEGQRIHHVIDPRTGRPSQGVHAATVLHADPALADAASTTLMIAGPEAWPEYARRMGVDQALVVLDDRIEATPAMAERLWTRDDLDPVEVRELP